MPYHVKIDGDRHGMCGTCSNSTIIRLDNNDVFVYCDAVYPPLRLTTRVTECSDYHDQQKIHRREFEETAWILRTDKVGRAMGFKPPESKKRDDI